MKVLIVKMSSLGDILHAFPALTDAGKAIPGIQFDWVVEEAFAELPKWHPLVSSIIPIAIRRWRKTPLRSLFSAEWRNFRKQLRSKEYDLVIDAQGLIKSAFITKMSKGIKVGFDKKSLTESLARFVYQKTVNVEKDQHAVYRMREIFAKALGYEPSKGDVDYGLSREQFISENNDNSDYIVFAHGTTWKTKHWVDEHWIELAKIAEKAGVTILLPWCGDIEKARVEKIAAQCSSVKILPKMNLTSIAGIIANAKGMISVDTGFSHLAAALNVPNVSIYGPTDPKYIGALGKNQIHVMPDFSCLKCWKKECFYKNLS